MVLLATPRFRRSFKKLTKELQHLVWEKMELFRITPFHPGLRTHKLTVGELWAFSVDHKNRVVFQFSKNDEVILVNVGDHSIYRKLTP